MSKWAAFCAEEYRFDIGRVTQSLDSVAELVFARDANGLRALVMGSVPGEVSVMVGPCSDGISDINLAAAVANDGNACRVVLARRELSGSLRSRAARAGIDLVVDLDEVEEGDAGAEPECDEGARASGTLESPSFSSVAEALGHRAGLSPGKAPILVFCSGRGGVGKTSLVATAAVHAASWGLHVAAVDLDLSCGNLYSCFGLPRGTDLARCGADEMGGAGENPFVMAAPGIHLAGPCERPETAELAAPHVGTVLERGVQTSDVVLVDTSTTFTDAVAQAAQMADRLVLVSDGRAGSVAALARSGGLAVRLGVARTRIARLENRANPRSKTNFSLARAEVGLEAARVFRAFEGGDEVGGLLGAGQAAELVDSGIAFADSVATTVAQLLAELGRLPGCEDAQRAAEGSTTRRWPALFARAREAR